MEYTLEQCKNISKLLKRTNIKLEDKKEIAELLLNTLNQINCKNCNYSSELPSWTWGFEFKCNALNIKTSENFLENQRLNHCPYIKYEDEARNTVAKYNSRK